MKGPHTHLAPMEPQTSPVPPVPQAEATAEVINGDQLNKIRAISLTAVGIVALFSYFSHIDYFPLFDLQAVSSYLFAVTWVLAVLLIGFALTFLLPYGIIGMSLKSRKTLKGERKLSATIIMWMGFGMLSLIGLSAGVLLVIWLQWNFLFCVLIGLAFSLLLCAIRTHFYVKQIKKNYNGSISGLWSKKVVRRLFLSQLGIAALTAFLQLLPLWVLLLMFSRASGFSDDDYLAFFTVSAQSAFFIAVVGGIVLHMAFILRLRKYWWIGLCSVLLLPLMLSGFSDSTGMLPMTMARITKIGNFRVERLILSPRACSSIAPILGTTCDEKASLPIHLCNVHIMSRVGPETYLRISGANTDLDGKHPIYRVFLPSADIMSMQVDFESKSLRLDRIDVDLGVRSSSCDAKPTTLHGDSAFGFDDFSLTDSGKAQLLTFVEQIKNGAQAIQEIKVTGYADQIGRAERNTWLSARRAVEVKLFLRQHLKNLLPEIEINAESKGSTHPLVENCSVLGTLKERIKCEAPNRRVELEIIRKARANPT